jgi:glycosyltransferase involved in cell wall biosynthesis
VGDKNSLVSVIIPCYNQGHFIDEALDSVFKQTYKNYEIIVINDGSTDDATIRKLDEINIANCKIIHTSNQGVSIARNIAINASKGEYILPLDADDKIGPKYLEESVKILDNKSDIGIVYCNAEFFGAISGRIKLPLFSIKAILFRNIIFNCALFRKKDFQKTPGYNPNMIFGWEDWDFWLSLIENGAEVYKLPDVHFYYRIGDSSSRNNEFEKSNEKRNYLLKTIYLNHIDFYLGNLGNPIEIAHKHLQISGSIDFRLGRFLLFPFRTIKRLYRRKIKNARLFLSVHILLLFGLILTCFY